MKYPVNNDTVEFIVIRSAELFCIGAYRIQADEQVSGQAVALTIVESNDVRVVVVLQILAVYFQNFFIGTENISDFTESFSIGSSYGFDPFRSLAFLDFRHFDSFCLLSYSHN